MNNMYEKVIIFTSLTTIRKYPEYIKYCEKYKMKALVLDEFNSLNHKLLKNKAFVNRFGKALKEIYLYESFNEAISKTQVWNLRYSIQGIINFRDNFVREADILCMLVGVRSPGSLASVICSRKDFQRKFFSRFSPQSEKCVLSDYLKNNNEFPFVIKPIKSSSSKNVLMISNANDYSLIPKEMFEQEVMVEDFIQGSEYSVESIVYGQNILFSGVTEKITNENSTNYFVEMSHVIPSQNLDCEKKKELKEFNRVIVESLQFENGIAHAEYKITDQGKIYLMEIACRTPGDAIMDLYSRSLGVEFPEIFFKSMLSDSNLINEIQNLKCSDLIAVQKYFEHPFGKLKNISSKNIPLVWFYENEELLYDSYVKNKLASKDYIYIYRERGDCLSEIKDSYCRSASVVYNCNKKSEIKTHFEDIINDVKYEF